MSSASSSSSLVWKSAPSWSSSTAALADPIDGSRLRVSSPHQHCRRVDAPADRSSSRRRCRRHRDDNDARTRSTPFLWWPPPSSSCSYALSAITRTCSGFTLANHLPIAMSRGGGGRRATALAGLTATHSAIMSRKRPISELEKLAASHSRHRATAAQLVKSTPKKLRAMRSARIDELSGKLRSSLFVGFAVSWLAALLFPFFSTCTFFVC